MKLPVSVKVGAWVYSIEEWFTRDANRDGFFATADHSCQQIKIDTAWGPHVAAASLLHEILHCIWKRWGIQEGDSQERAVQAMEYGLAAVWRDNPGVMRWIGVRLTR